MKKLIILLAASVLASISAIGQFPRDQKIDAAEYFIDTDPGVGNATAIAIGSTPLWEVTMNMQNLSVQAGSKVYVRFRSTNGTWSAPRAIRRMEYFPNQGAHIEYGEYYINDDPGYGNGTEVEFNTSGLLNLNGLDLQRGDKVFLRVRDSYNRWSNARLAKFNYKDIDFAEYTVKHESGDSTSQFLMSVSQTNPSSCVYTSDADTDTNSIVKNDVVYVRMRTSERFYSKWAHSSPYIPPPPSSLSDPEAANKIQVFPNPFKDYFHLKITIDHPVVVKIQAITLTGQSIMVSSDLSLVQGENSFTVHGMEFMKGIYTIILLSEDNVLSKTRIIKM